MRSLLYIVRKEFKNGFKEIFRKPGKLILYIIIILSIGASIAFTLLNEQHGQGRLPAEWIKGIYFAYITLFFVTFVQQGLSAGGTIFEMQDANFLFVSPINSSLILFYRLIRLAKTSFLSAFFILLQGSTISNFGLHLGDLFILFFMFMIAVVLLSILSMVIYSFTNASPKRKLLVKIVAPLLFAPAAIYFVYQFLSSGDAMSALLQTISSFAFNVIPFAGWASAASFAFINNNILSGIIWIAALLLCAAAIFTYILKSSADYYEDVLVATETAFERKRDAETNIQTTTTAKIKVTKTGIGGYGASAFFYKHLRETFRENRFGFFNIATIIALISIILAAVFMRKDMSIVIILQVLMWMQIFMVGIGRGLKEVYSHFIYMVSENPFKKVAWSNFELVFKTLLESIFFFGISGIILGENFFVILGAILAFTFFTLLLISINYLMMKLTGVQSVGLALMIYFVAVVILILPGLVSALIVGFSVGDVLGAIAGLSILAVWELIVALICFALSKNILHNSDMPTMTPSTK